MSDSDTKNKETMTPLVVDLLVASHGKKSVNVSERADLNSAKDFLLEKPFGVYTCARITWKNSVENYEIVLFDFHLERLKQGLSLSSSEYQEEKKSDQLKQDTLRCTERLLEELNGLEKDEEKSDVMLTIVWFRSSTSKIYTCAVYSCKMPQITQHFIQVLVHGPRRSHAACKHSKWIEERKTIEEYTTAFGQEYQLTISETILSTLDDGGEKILLEGLITNFFVVMDGKVYTTQATQGGHDSPVLAGSTRQLVLKACTRLGIDVVEQPPRLGEALQWQAAFVTSVVRVAVQVTDIHWETSDRQHRYVHLDHPEGDEILQAIRRDILDHQYFV